MFYKPKYCCSCGEKIERTEWNLLTSRRFCESCAQENKRHDMALRTLVAAGALGFVFGIGTFWGSAGSEQSFSAVPVAVKAVELSVPNKAVTASLGAQPEPQSTTSDNYIAQGENSAKPSESTENQRAAAKFFCGALTKKGTPCSRKVKSNGLRCFQHEGKPAVPPQD